MSERPPWEIVLDDNEYPLPADSLGARLNAIAAEMWALLEDHPEERDKWVAEVRSAWRGTQSEHLARALEAVDDHELAALVRDEANPT